MLATEVSAMTVDPLDYDVDELRDLAGVDGYERVLGDDGFIWFTAADGDDRPDPEMVQEWARMVARGNTKPYLKTLPSDPESRELVHEWLSFLVQQVGLEGTLEALQYYRAREWLGERALADVEDHLFAVEPVEGNRADELEPADHMQSLRYIAQLAKNRD